MPEAVVDARLLTRMREVARHVELYRRLWSTSGIERDLQKAPRLDKAALRACKAEDRVHSGRRGGRLMAELSSGSSGEPMTIYCDRAALRARRFAFLSALIRSGYRPGQRCLLLTSRRDSKWSGLARWHYASIAEDTDSLAERVKNFSPRVLYGPLSTLELLADHFAKRKERLPALALVVSTAEQLTPERKLSLDRTFGVPVADFYGMTEFGLVAYRPPGSQHFVVARSSLILEFIPIPHDSAIEQLIVTDLAERTSPLVRYDTGDFVRRDGSRTDRPILEFAGREFDCIALPNGCRVSPYRIDVALEHLPELRAYEVLQQPDLSIDVTIDVASRNVDGIRSAIAQKLAAVLGNALPVRIAAEAVRRGPPGTKFRPIRSLARISA